MDLEVNMGISAERQVFIDGCVEKLMRFRDYSPRMHLIPFEQNYGEKDELFVFGSGHVAEVGHEMFMGIEDRLRSFLTGRKPGDVHVIVEGGLGQRMDTREEAEKAGEAIFTIFIAAQNGITNVESPDPKIDELRDVVEAQGMDVETFIFREYLNNIFYKTYFVKSAVTVQDLVDFYRYVYSKLGVDWVNLSAQLGHTSILDEAELRAAIKSKRESLGAVFQEWFEPTMRKLVVAKFKQMAEKWGVKVESPAGFNADAEFGFDVDQLETLVSPRDPDLPDTTLFPKASGAMSRYRDEVVLRRILELLEQGKSVFCVFGASHVYMWKPVFEAYFDQDQA